MGFSVVRNLVTNARLQDETPTILKFCMQFPLKAKEDVTLRTPMVGEIAGCVLDHAYADWAKL
jgi:hypothetical protein